MKLLWQFLLALAVAVGAGQLVSHDAGLVTVSYGQKILRMSLSVALVLGVVGAFVSFIVARATWRLITIRRRWRQWREVRQRARNHQLLSDGLLALAAGEPARAERLLAKASGDAVTPAHFLAAAQAAHAQQAPSRRDTYLALARDLAPNQSLALGLQQAEMALAAGEHGAAAKTVQELATTHPSHKQVLALRHRLSVAADAWDDVALLLPELKRAGVYAEPRLIEIQAECAARALAKPYANRAALDVAWDALPKPVKAQPVVIAAYTRDLLGLQEFAVAESVLRKALNTQWDSRLLSLYGELIGNAAKEALAHAERWLTAHQDDAALLLALGRLCFAQSLWGKARQYLEASLARQPSALVHRLLAEVLDHLAEPGAAAKQRQLGLELATQSVAALPRF